MGIVKFTQFLMPLGTRREIEMDAPDKETRDYDALVKSGAVFEIEMLPDYRTISAEIAIAPGVGGQERTVLSSLLVENGPEVPPAILKMISEAYERAKDLGVLKEFT